ncbi:MAG: FliI/YscN family ATPase [Hyphomonas sp.]
MFTLWGTVTALSSGMITIEGISEFAGIGNEISITTRGQTLHGEILSVSSTHAIALLFSGSEEVRIGDRVVVHPEATITVGDHWLGKVVNYRGDVTDNQSPFGQVASRPLNSPPPDARNRRSLGGRLNTGLMMTDTLLPICRGQRIGLFAGSGVGKSTLLGALAKGVGADRIVIGLIGERSREVNEFAQRILSPEAAARTVIVAATASEPPGAKKRAAFCATAAAEHFRDEGHSVLLIMDSITRFAEAHRETALLAGETPALNAFPPSTVRVISELAERSGPGADTQGDITAIYSVLVAGSDMEEPVADMIRGVLDGHIILSRDIAERGRYPAVDILRSVSRSLPNAANEEQNQLLTDYRRNIALYEEVAPMLRADLYEYGKDAATDRAIALYPALDEFVGSPNPGTIEEAFYELRKILSGGASDEIQPA